MAGGPVAEHGIGSAAENGGELAPRRGQGNVPDRVDATVKAAEPSGSEPPPYPLACEAEIEQLRRRDNTVLTVGELTTGAIHGVWAVFLTVFGS